MFKKLKKFRRHIFLSFILILVTYLTYVFLILKPSNNRNWEVGFEKLPQIQIDDNLVTITNLRNYRYTPGKFISANYTNRTVDISKLKRVWFLVEPFDGLPLVSFNGIAHTYFVFDFEDEKPLVLSVEARREKDEQFGLFSGMMNKFELMYVWGTEEDITQRRILIEDNKLYMYLLTISQSSGQNLFLQLIETTQQLETEPRFYNSLFSNCTNELAKNANTIKPGSIPYNLVWFFPGYSVNELYKLGYIPNDIPLEEVSKKYFISDIVKKYFAAPNFSEKLRQEIL